jgi:O-antigen/teichoic acid export membrane protein
VLKKILNTFGTRLASALLNLLIAIIVSQFLGPEGKGEQGIILATIAYILVFSNLFGGSAIVYLVPRFTSSVIVAPAYAWALITSFGFYFLLHTFELVQEPFIVHVCVLSAISAFTAINTAVLIGKEKIASSNLIAFIQPLVITLSLVVLFLSLHLNSITSYIIALYISIGVAFVVSLIYLSKNTEKFRFEKPIMYAGIVAQLFKYGLLNQLAHIFQLLSFRMSFYWLELTYSSAEVGVYSNGTSLVESIWLISRSISLVQYARIANTDDRPYAQKLSLQLTYASLALSIIPLLILVLLPPAFFTALYGEGFGEVGLVITALAPGVLFFNIALIIGHYFSGIGKYHINTLSSFVGLLVAVGAFSLMIPAYGIAGAGWATSISYLSTCIILLWFFAKESQIGFRESLPDFKEVKALLLSVVGREKR